MIRRPEQQEPLASTPSENGLLFSKTQHPSIAILPRHSHDDASARTSTHQKFANAGHLRHVNYKCTDKQHRATLSPGGLQQSLPGAAVVAQAITAFVIRCGCAPPSAGSCSMRSPTWLPSTYSPELAAYLTSSRQYPCMSAVLPKRRKQRTTVDMDISSSRISQQVPL